MIRATAKKKTYKPKGEMQDFKRKCLLFLEEIWLTCLRVTWRTWRYKCGQIEENLDVKAREQIALLIWNIKADHKGMILKSRQQVENLNISPLEWIQVGKKWDMLK